MTTETSRVRSLNDSFRKHLVSGTVLLTPGVNCLPQARQVVLIKLVREFDKFTPENDPHGEHDFGAVGLAGEWYFFKIDYSDLSKTIASPNPADAAVMLRVWTLMRADEILSAAAKALIRCEAGRLAAIQPRGPS